MIVAAEDEAELAGVLAHEIGHIFGRHSANQLVSQLGLQLIGAIALGEDASEYAVYIANVTAQLSRDDPYGLRYVVESECDTRGLVRFFKKLGGLESGAKNKLENLFSSHPATEERIRDLETRIGRLSVKTGRRDAQRYMRETAALRRLTWKRVHQAREMGENRGVRT